MWGAIFSGQGSQTPGMGKFLDDNFKEAQRRFDEASEVLGYDTRKLCFSGSEEDLQRTENTQPMLLLNSIAAFDVLTAKIGFQPQAGAGHSVGEYAAMVSAGVIPFKEALLAVRTRGQAMQKAVPVGDGGMCAVMGLNDDQVRDLCAWVEKESDLKPLSPANFNSPGQVVISGRQSAIAWLQANFRKEIFGDTPVRAKFISLKVSAPFHCAMMAPAEKTMADVLGKIEFKDAHYAIVQNYSAHANTDRLKLRDELVHQVTAPVLWTQCMQTLKALGVTRLIECGPGRVLAGLAKKIDSECFNVFNLNSLDDLKVIEENYAKP